MIPIVALMEQGSLKAWMAGELDVSLPNEGEKSDWLVELRAFQESERRLNLFQERKWDELRELLGENAEEFFALNTNKQKHFLLKLLNVSMKKFWDTKKMIKKLRRSLRRDLSQEEYRAATPTEIRRCILAGQVNTLHVRGDYSNQIRHYNGGKFYISRNSKVTFCDGCNFASGELITITSKGRQFTFFTQVTVYDKEDLMDVVPYLIRDGQIFGYNI